MSWANMNLVQDTEIGALEPEATASTAPWGQTTWSNARAEAKRDIKIWLETDFAKIPNVADRIKDTHKPEKGFQKVSGAFTDRTTEIADDTEEDLDLSDVFVTVGTDRLLIGSGGEFSGVFVKMLDSFNSTSSVLTVKYTGAGGLTSLTASDGTAVSGKTFAKGGRITWNIPTDWVRWEIGGSEPLYWIELSVSVTPSADTLISQMLVVKAPDALKRVAAYRALGYIFKGLAVQAPKPQWWLDRVNNDKKTGYWDLADNLYAALRDKGGIPIDINEDDAIDPGSETNVVQPITIGRA